MMALRPAREPLADVPNRLTDGSRLVGVVTGGTPVYHDPDDDALRDAAVDPGPGAGAEATQSDPVPETAEAGHPAACSCRHTIGPDESVADAITTVERRSGWAVLSEYGLEHLSDA